MLQWRMTANRPLPLRRGPLRRAARAALFPLGLLGYAFVLAEEWLWITGQAAAARLAGLPGVQAAERALAKAPPWAAACAFLVPGLVLFPFKIGALALIAHGHPLLGAAAFGAAKFAGAALVARVWKIAEPSLRQVAWIARSVDWTVAKKDQFKAWFGALWAIRAAQAAIAGYRARPRGAPSRAAAKLWAKAVARARGPASPRPEP